MLSSTPRRRVRKRLRVGKVTAYLHHGAWWLYYRENFRPVRRRIGPDRDSAIKLASQTNAQLASGSPTHFSHRNVAVAELVDRFHEFHELARSSPATLRRYRTALQHLVNFAARTPSLKAAQDLDAAAFLKYLRSIQVSPNGHANTTKRSLRDKGVLFVLGVCRSLYHFAIRQHLLPPYARNPISDLRIERIRVQDAKPLHVFSEGHFEGFSKACDRWAFPLFFTLAQTGMRSGEMLHLLIEDVDLVGGWIHVRNKPALGWRVKTRSERSIPIFDQHLELLRSLIGQRRAGVLFLRRRFGTSEPPLVNLNACSLGARLRQEIPADKSLESHGAFEGRAGHLWRDAGRLRCSRLRMEFIRIARRAGMAEMTCPKIFRHTFATRLQDANVDWLIRQQVMGHSSAGANLGMTANYTHTRPQTCRDQLAGALQISPTMEARITKWLERANQVHPVVTMKTVFNPKVRCPRTTTYEVNTMKNRVAIYCRMSSDMQRKESLKDQEHQVRKGLERLGIDHSCARVFKDEAISGMKGEEGREGFRLMMESARRGEIDIIAVDDQSRFGRQDDVYSIIKDLDFEKIRFLSFGDGIDTQREGWQISSKFNEMKNSFQMQQQARQVRRGQSGRVRDGGSAGDFVFGYTSEVEDPNWMRIGERPKMKVIILDEEAQWVKKIYDWYCQGHSVNSIVRKLNKLNVPKGRKCRTTKWYPDLICRMLRNTKYIGKWTYGKTTTRRNSQGRVRQVPVDPSEIVHSDRPELRIIDDDVWEQVQARIAKNKNTYMPSHRKKRQPAHYSKDHPKGLLNGLLMCKCGNALCVVTTAGRPSFGCTRVIEGLCDMRTRVSRDQAEQLIMEMITPMLLESSDWAGQILALIHDNLKNGQSQSQTRIDPLEKQLREIDSQIANLTKAVAQGTGLKSLLGALQECERRKIELEAELDDARRTQSKPIKLPDAEYVSEQLHDLLPLIDKLSPDALHLLRSYIGPIQVVEVIPKGKKRGNVDLYFHPNDCEVVRQVILRTNAARDEQAPEELCGETEVDDPLCVVSLKKKSQMDQHAEKIYELRSAGLTLAEIADQTKLGISTVHRYYKRYIQNQNGEAA